MWADLTFTLPDLGLPHQPYKRRSLAIASHWPTDGESYRMRDAR